MPVLVSELKHLCQGESLDMIFTLEYNNCITCSGIQQPDWWLSLVT